MENQENIDINQRNGNLHIKLEGLFTEETAIALTRAMIKSYQGAGNIFIHTGNVTEVVSDSGRIFSSLLGISGLPRDNVYLIGRKGMDIGYDRARVIVYEKKGHCGCGNLCKSCKRQERRIV